MALICTALSMPQVMREAEIRYDCVSAGRAKTPETMIGGVTAWARAQVRLGEGTDQRSHSHSLNPASMARQCCRPQTTASMTGSWSSRPKKGALFGCVDELFR